MDAGDHVACARCGTFVDPGGANYSEDGELVCRACEARYTIRQGEERAANGIASMGLGVLTVGAFSLFFNPWNTVPTWDG